MLSIKRALQASELNIRQSICRLGPIDARLEGAMCVCVYLVKNRSWCVRIFKWTPAELIYRTRCVPLNLIECRTECDTLVPMTTIPGSTGSAGGPAVKNCQLVTLGQLPLGSPRPAAAQTPPKSPAASGTPCPAGPPGGLQPLRLWLQLQLPLAGAAGCRAHPPAAVRDLADTAPRPCGRAVDTYQYGAAAPTWGDEAAEHNEAACVISYPPLFSGSLSSLLR